MKSFIKSFFLKVNKIIARLTNFIFEISNTFFIITVNLNIYFKIIFSILFNLIYCFYYVL